MSTIFEKDYLKFTGLDIRPTTSVEEINELKISKQPLSSTQVENNNGLESQSSTSDQVQVTGGEIQPYVKSKNEVTGQEIIEHSQNGGWQLLRHVIKETLKAAKLQAKKMTAVLSKPKVLDGELVMVPIIYGMVGSNTKAKMKNKLTRPMIRKQKSKATSVGEFDLFFNFPKEYDACVEEIEKLSKHKVKALLPVANEKMPQLLFSERLTGWTIERKQRVAGTYDVYYHHVKSFITFRSTVEVSNFILDNSYPGNSSAAKKRKSNRSPGYSRRVKASLDWNKKISSCDGSIKLKDTWVEEDTLRFHDHVFKNLHDNSHENITTYNDPSTDSSEATESDEEIKSMIKQHNEFLISLSKAKKEKKGKEKRTSQSSNEVESNRVIPMAVKQEKEEHNNPVVEVPGVKNVENMAEDFSKTTGEKIALVEEAPVEVKQIALVPNPAAPTNQVQSAIHLAVIKPMWSNAFPIPNTDSPNDCLYGDIYDQLGDLDSSPSVHLAVHVLSNQFNLEDEEKEEDSIWKKTFFE